MVTQKEKADAFGDLHIKGSPLILFNIWDAGSGRTIEQAGAKAIATGSWSVAAAASVGSAIVLREANSKDSSSSAAAGIPYARVLSRRVARLPA